MERSFSHAVGNGGALGLGRQRLAWWLLVGLEGSLAGSSGCSIVSLGAFLGEAAEVAAPGGNGSHSGARGWGIDGGGCTKWGRGWSPSSLGLHIANNNARKGPH